MFKNVANWRLELRSISRNVFPLQKLSLKELLMEKKKTRLSTECIDLDKPRR